MLHSDWIKDGTPSETPTTSVTPDPEIATPAAADTAAASPAEPPAAPESAQDAAAQAAAAAAATGADASQQQAAAQAAVQQFIEAQLDGKPYQIPVNAALPLKRGEEIEYVPVGELQKRGMLEKDYRVKTGELAEQRRALDVERRVMEARTRAMEQWHQEQQQFLERAYANPEDQARYESFVEQYRSNPAFKQMVDDALTARVMQAERAAISEVEGETALATEVQQLSAAIERIGQKYPGVPVDEIRQQYAQDLQLDRTWVGEDAIESYFQRAHEKRAALLSPLEQKIEALSRQLATLTEQQQAAQHNANTQQRIARAANPVAAPAGGTAAHPAPAATQLKGKDIAARSREWAALRD